MTSRMAKGEVILALLFAALGLLWTVLAARMELWDGFAPSSGFLPLIYGVLVTGLSLAVLAQLLVGRDLGTDDGSELRKPLVVLATLLVAVVGTGVVGFAISVFAMLLFLYAVVERLNVGIALAVSLGVTIALYVVFKTWLGVPLPPSPFGVL